MPKVWIEAALVAAWGSIAVAKQAGGDRIRLLEFQRRGIPRLVRREYR